MNREGASQPQRSRGDGGAAIVEMAAVGILLVFLLFGIVSFGFLMSFRQNMTQAAAEGARAGAVAQGSQTDAARDAAQQALGEFGKNCSGGMTCATTVIPCPQATGRQCIQVILTYDYANNPLLPDIPLVSVFFPSSIQTKSVAEINQ